MCVFVCLCVSECGLPVARLSDHFECNYFTPKPISHPPPPPSASTENVRHAKAERWQAAVYGVLWMFEVSFVRKDNMRVWFSSLSSARAPVRALCVLYTSITATSNTAQTHIREHIWCLELSTMPWSIFTCARGSGGKYNVASGLLWY